MVKTVFKKFYNLEVKVLPGARNASPLVLISSAIFHFVKFVPKATNGVMCHPFHHVWINTLLVMDWQTWAWKNILDS